jgi:predicted DNA-binding protein (UPF0251 family)
MTTSTAEAPALIDREKRSQIIWFIRATVSPGEAEAMASGGYRSMPCGGCGRLTCEACSREPVEQVHGGSGKRASADPNFVRAIVARLGQFPRPVIVRTHKVVARLPDLERLVLLLHDGAGMDQEQVGRHLKISRSTVHRVRERALSEVVRQVWEPST